MTASTHVLDATRGVPAAAVAVVVERSESDGSWVTVAEADTDADGRIGDLAGELEAGVYRLRFATGDYFEKIGTPTFYPEVAVTFRVTDAAAHHHVPLLLSPFAYSTYRGT